MKTTLFNCSSSSEPWQPERRQNIVIALSTLPQGWVSARKHQCTTAITTMWTESSWAFPERYTADDSWIVRSSDGGQLGDKRALTPTPRWVSAQLLYVSVSVRQRSRGCSHNLRRPFLRAVRFLYLYYIILHYASQFFRYQECDIALRGTIFPLPGV